MESTELAIKFFEGWSLDWVLLFILTCMGIGLAYIYLKTKDVNVATGEGGSE